MTLPFKPHVLALFCSAVLFAASGVMYVKSRTPEAPQQPAPVATAAPVTAAPVEKPAFTSAQIDQWVAPVALYPDPLLSQVLMASTYPANVVQAVQWSRDNPTLQGDAAIQAVSGQPWDPSVKSLVAFPQLMALMGENPQWVQNLGDAFLAQPQDVMDAVQRLRQLAQQTGSLKSTPQQTVTLTPKKNVAVAQSASPAPSSTPTIIKIEPADPQVVYVPNYNPATVYGSWPNTALPPVYLPPPPGEQFTSSFVKGFGYSLGVATTYALFSNIDWDNDDHHHHHDDDHHHDDHHHDDGYPHHDGYQHNGDNININVNHFNRITGQHLQEQNLSWHHNPAYRDGVPYRNSATAQRFHQTSVSGGLSATPTTTPATRDAQRQAAMAQLQQRHPNAATQPQASSRDAQRNAAKQIAQRNNYRGYDTDRASALRQAQHNATSPQPQQRREALKTQIQQHPLSQQQRDTARQRIASATPEQRQTFRQNHANVFSGNDSRSPDWQSQQRRGQESRRVGKLSGEQRAAARERLSEHHEFHRR